MRLDHIAYRVADRRKTAEFFVKAFGYHLQTEFDIDFDDGSAAKCIALEPPEKPVAGKLAQPMKRSSENGISSNGDAVPDLNWAVLHQHHDLVVPYHLAPEIFISDGDPSSIVGQWVAARGGVGGIHHLAYQVDSVEATMREWKEKGYAEFSTEDVLRCPDLVQVFTKPSALTGVIYEFIQRGKHGFCADNVKDLMHSTKSFK
jgi:4-hydroxyphenylpyruvate dioxygenase-like putative hemolysin